MIPVPYQHFIDPTASRLRAVDNGFIYLGAQDTDPTKPENQLPVFYIDENGETKQVSQPILLNSSGVPCLSNGTLYNPQVSTTYASIVLQNKRKVTIYDHKSWPILNQYRKDLASSMGLVYDGEWHPGIVIPDDAMTNKLAYWYDGKFYSVGTDNGFTSNDFDADLAAGKFIDETLATKKYVTDSIQKSVVFDWQFGITGSGDETEKIRNLHTFANDKNLEVKYTVPSITFDGQAQIEVKTDIDFDDTILKPQYSGALGYNLPPAFLITGNSLETVAVDQSQLKKGSTQIYSLVSKNRGTLFISSTIPFCKRTPGGSYENMRDINKITKRGELLYPLNYDMTTGGTVTAQFRSDENSWITIKGGLIDTENFLSGTVFKTQRNQVIYNVSVIRDLSESQQDNIRELIYFDKVADILLKDINGEAQTHLDTNIGGTYTIASGDVCNLILDNVEAMAGWGAVGLNGVNGLYANQCKLNRLDVHFGGFNIYVDGGVYSEWGITLGCGGGDLNVHNVKRVFGRSVSWDGGEWPDQNLSLITMRGDYGNNWDGDIDVKNITFEFDPSRPLSGATYENPNVFSVIHFTSGVPVTSDSKFAEYGYSQTVIWGKTINVRDIKVNAQRSWLDSYLSFVPVNFDKRYVLPAIQMPYIINVENVNYTEMPTAARICPIVPPALTKLAMQPVNNFNRYNCEISISNVNSGNNGTVIVNGKTGTDYLDFYLAQSDVTDCQLVANIDIINSSNVSVHYTIPGQVTVSNSEIASMNDFAGGYNGGTYLFANDCRLIVLPNNSGSRKLGRVKINGGSFKNIGNTANIDLSDIDSSKGCLVENAVIFSGHTAAELFNGVLADVSSRYQ